MENFNFEQQVANYMPFLNGYSKRFFLDDEDRQDLVSDTILKALDKKEYFREGDENGLRGWLVTVMTRIFINNYRRESRYATDHYDNEQMTLLTEQKQYSKDTDADSICDELSEVVKRSLSALDYRILMAFANGYAYEQISEIMELPVGTVKSKIFLARKKVMKNIKSNDYE